MISKSISYFLIAISLSNLIIGGILVPRHQAQAFCTPGIDVAMFSLDKIQWSWNKVTWAYQKAASAIQSGVSTWNKSKILRDDATKAAWNVLRKRMLNMLVDDIVKWIQGTGGKPRIVTDWKAYLEDAANKAGGDFVNYYLNAGFLCSPLRTQLRFALQRTELSFEEQTRCTLGDIENNLENFYQNFNNGGWEACASLSESQNNFYGAYLYAMDQKIAYQAAAQLAAQNQAGSSGGYLGDTICLARTCTGSIYGQPGKTFTWYESAPIKNGVQGWTDGAEKDTSTSKYYTNYYAINCSCSPGQTKIRTPGKILADTASKAVNVDIDWLISAKEFNEYLGSILDAVVNRVTREGLAFMSTGSNYHPQGNAPSIDKISSGVYTDTTESQNLTASMITELKRLSANLKTLSSQYQANLNFLLEIQSRQNVALRTLAWIIKNGCLNYPDFLVNDGQAMIWDLTDIPHVLDSFPSDTSGKKIKIELQNAGDIILEYSSPGNPNSLNVSSSTLADESLIERYQGILNRPNGKEMNLIENQQAAIETALGNVESYKDLQNAYADANTAYLKANPIDETTGLKTYNFGNLTLDLGSYKAMIPQSQIDGLTSLFEAKDLAMSYAIGAPDPEISSLAQTLLLNSNIGFLSIKSENDAINLAGKINPTADTDEILILGKNLWGVKQEQNLQIAANNAKDISDASIKTAIKSTLDAVNLLDKLDKLSVAAHSENTDLTQLYREVQGYSSDIADQAGSLETKRGISQSSPLSPRIQCNDDQKQSKSLLGDFCVTNNEVYTLAPIYLQMKAATNNPKEKDLTDKINKIGDWSGILGLKSENSMTVCPTGLKY